MRTVAALLMAVLLVLAAACISTDSIHHTVYCVSPDGNGTNGHSWATAWRDTSLINWSVIRPGSQIMIDGGTSTCSVLPYDFRPSSPAPGVTCEQRYRSFSIGQNDITIERSTAAGHNGTVIIDGGRDTCGCRK